MKPTVLVRTTAVFGGIGLLIGCSAQEPGGARSTASALSASCPTLTALYEMPSWIASCPAGPAGWTATQLFPGASGKLGRYCRYSWTTNPNPDFALLTAALQVATNSSNVAEPDCPVVAPLGFAEAPEIWKPLRKNYLTQASYVSDLPPGKERVRVAVIDSAARPFSSLQNDTFGHGRAVGRVIDELSCPPGGYCASEMWNVLALPQVTSTTTDTDTGGYYGTRGQLAEAIFKAVDDWVYDLNKSPKTVPPRLLLNLSVGWVPEYGGTDIEKMPLSARAVFDALEHAACYGALAIAAAGNDSGDASAGPMLPGGWETVAAPEKCEGYELPTEYPLWSGDKAPLVYAASAVDSTDRPLANTRVGGQARLVAYGDSVVTADSRSAGITDNMTGSSMSAAVTSGAAAAAWAYRPDWTRDQLMQAVTDSAVELVPGDPTGHRVVDFCLGGAGCSGKPLARVSVCNAVTKSYCSAGCSDVPKCNTPKAHAGLPASLPDPSTIYPMPGTSIGPVCSPGAGSGSCGTGGETALFAPWVTPQPIPGCDVCVLSMTGNLYIDLTNPGYTDIQAMTLLMYDARYNLISSQRILSPTGRLPYPEVFWVDAYVPYGTAAAELRFYIDDGTRPYSTREPLRIY